MNVDFYKAFAYLLLALHLTSYVLFHMMIRRCDFKTPRLKKYLVRKSRLLNLCVNSALIFVCLTKTFSTRKISSIIEIFSNASFSYGDIAKLGVSAFICVFLSMVCALICCALYRNRDDRIDISSKQRSLLLLVTSIALVPLIFSFFIGGNSTNSLRITDVCRRYETRVVNDRTEEDLPEDYSSVTLSNTGAIKCDVDSVYLSVERDDLQQIALKKVSLAPGEEYTFDFPANDSLLIKKDGTSVLYLSNERGDILDQLSIPTLVEDAHYRKTDSGWNVVEPAPAIEETPIVVPAPVFSAEGGFYDEPFDLTISAEPGLKIYYTLDCSEPDENALLYASPISIYDRSEEPNVLLSTKQLVQDYLEKEQSSKPVRKCTVIRAVTMDAAGNLSDVVTSSYFIGESIAKHFKDIPVLSVVSSPDGLIGPNGILVTGPEYDAWYEDAFKNAQPGTTIDKTGAPAQNYNQHGMDWERIADIQFFDEGKLSHQQIAGVRVQGNVHRRTSLKRLSLYARDEYNGSDYFPFSINNSFHPHSLVIRRGTAQAFSQRLCADRDVLTIDFIPMALFVNGEYFYKAYLYEKFDEKNIAQKYGLTEQNIELIKNGEVSPDYGSGVLPIGKSLNFIDQIDLSTAEGYAAVDAAMDIQSYIDCLCINGYLSNLDVSEYAFNSLNFRTILKENDDFGDTRWRFGLIDMDLLLDIESSIHEADAKKEPWRLSVFNNASCTPIKKYVLYSALRTNPIFCRQFVLTFMDLVNTNFAPENAEAVLNDLGITDELYRNFFAKRPEYAVADLYEEFELTGTPETVTLSSNRFGAPITLNTVTPKLKNQQWSGVYFTDYPVTVTAADSGFDHWEITADGQTEIRTEPSIEVPVVKGGIQIHAVYQR